MKKKIITYLLLFSFLHYIGCTSTVIITAEEMHYKVKKENNVGIELTFYLIDNNEISGEILSVRDDSIIICEKYSATEEEIAEGIFPIYSINRSKIETIIIESEPEIMTGVGYGVLIGTAVGVLAGLAYGDKGGYFSSSKDRAIIGAVAGAGIGAVIGGIWMGNSPADKVIIQLPPDYDFSALKPLARYPDEEPEFLKKIM